MIDMYFKLITNTDSWNLSRVPSKYRDDVQLELERQGFNENGNKLGA